MVLDANQYQDKKSSSSAELHLRQNKMGLEISFEPKLALRKEIFENWAA